MAPPQKILKRDFENIKILGLPSYETLGLNSVRMYAAKSSDVVMNYSEWFTAFQNKHFSPFPPNKAHVTARNPSLATVRCILHIDKQKQISIIEI